MTSADVLNQISADHAELGHAAGAIARVTKGLLPAGAEVSVVALRGSEVHTVAATSAVARVLDGWQYRTDEGPCLQALASAASVYAADLRIEDRWPRWVRHGVDAGARSVLSLGLGIDGGVTGALNVYSTEPDAFPGDTVVIPQGVAACAAVAMKIIDRYDAQAAQLRHVQAAMVHRAVIEQAKGIIMGERRCTADEAFAILTKVSQDSNTKVRDVAAALVHRAASTPGLASGPAATPARRAGPAMTARHHGDAAPALVTAATSRDTPTDVAGAPAQFTTDVDGCGVAVIAVAGELVMDTADDLLDAVTAALTADPLTRVVIDLARVSFLDMAALGVLVRVRDAVLRAGASFRVVRPQPLVRQVMHRTDTCVLLTTAPPAVDDATLRSTA